MSKNRLFNVKYVLMAVIILSFLVIGSLILNFNYLDAFYLIFLLTCVIRYIIICKEK